MDMVATGGMPQMVFEYILKQNNTVNIDDLLKKVPDLTFVDYLDTLCDYKNISKSELIKKTTLDRTYAYQIFNGTRIPGSDKVIQLALALSLDLHDTNNLLTLSQNKSLYPKIKRDALIILCINKHYCVLKTNELLDEYKYKIKK